MKLYIYDTDTKQVVATAIGAINAECECKAANANYDDADRYGWTYSPAFGANDGLIETDDVIEL